MTVLTDKELCELLRVSRQTVWRLRKNEGLPFFRVGNQYRYDMDDIQKWLARTKYKDSQLILPLNRG